MTVQTDDVLDTETNIDDEDLPHAGADRGDNFDPEGADSGAQDADAVADEAEQKPDDDDAAQAARMIPKSRFDEVNNAKKQAEQENTRLLAEIEALRKGETAPPSAAAEAEPAATPEIQDLERQYIDAMMDGDVDKAVGIKTQINEAVRVEARREALQEIEQSKVKATIEQRVNEAATSVIGKYPAFDDDNEAANEEAIAELVEMRDFYISIKGMHPAEAITKAADKVAAMYGLVATSDDPVVDPRTKAAIERGARVASAQPNTGAVGVGTRQDGGRVNIQAMTDEQFDALPEAEKRRLRGD